MIVKYSERAAEKPKAIIDFYAVWCEPCLAILPALEKLGGEFSRRIVIYKVNVEEMPEVAEQYDVQGLPTVIFLRGGAEVFRHTGAWNMGGIRDAIREFLEEE